MKKAILTAGLFSMMLVLTSFTTPSSYPTKDLQLAEIKYSNEIGVGQQVPAQMQSLESAVEPGGNGQQVPAQRPSL